MNESRRSILRKVSALSALAVGASGVASAANCSDAPDWDATTLYEAGDRVIHPDTDGVQALWEAALDSRNAEPSSSSAYWDHVGDCDGDGGGGENESPTATFTTDVSTPDPGQDVTFDANGSSDPDGSIASYEWEFGDGSTGSGATTSHSYDDAGDYTVTLTVTDDAGATDTDSTTVSVSSGNAAPDASFTVSPSAPEPGESVTFDAADSSDADGTIASYDWDLGDGSSASGESVSHSFEEGEHTVTLTVTDDEGATDSNATTVSVGSDGGGGGTGDDRVIGYWMQWAQYDREYVPADIPTDQVTHVQYAFMRPESDGTISGLGDSHAQRFLFPESWHDDITTFEDISNDTDVTVLISIGGWSDSENFSDAALTEDSRKTFADECVRIVREAGVDGVDIDWEFPGGGGHPDNTVRDGDQARFTKLIQACRDALDTAGAEDGRNYHLSAATSADPSTVEGHEHGQLSDLLDFTSVMTFDYRGGFSDYTGHNSPLHHNPDDPADDAADWNVEAALSYYVNQGWDPGQLNMATPFYGRSWTGVESPSDGVGNGVDDGLFQTFADTGDGSFPPDTSESGIYDYWDLAVEGTGRSTSQVDLSTTDWETMLDDTATAAYSYNQTDGMMISHETPNSVAQKMDWLASSDYGGTMIWALSHDTIEHHLLDEISGALL